MDVLKQEGIGRIRLSRCELKVGQSRFFEIIPKNFYSDPGFKAAGGSGLAASVNRRDVQNKRYRLVYKTD